jgi:hypothetical protein
MTFDEFLKWEQTSRDTIDVKRIYIDITGDLIAGILLSQIIYWFLPKQGKRKIKIFKDNHYWLAKRRQDWWEECRISPKQFDRAIRILKKRNLVVTRTYRFYGSPTMHIHLNEIELIEKLDSILSSE